MVVTVLIFAQGGGVELKAWEAYTEDQDLVQGSIGAIFPGAAVDVSPQSRKEDRPVWRKV